MGRQASERVDTFHPVLASPSQSLVTSAIDGFFDCIPAESTVLLRRVKNGLPTMFMYPYGQAFVIVSASYDDWGGFNQSAPGARAIIRDAIAWDCVDRCAGRGQGSGCGCPWR